MTFLIPEKSRETVRAYLANSGSLGVQAILRTRERHGHGPLRPGQPPRRPAARRAHPPHRPPLPGRAPVADAPARGARAGRDRGRSATSSATSRASTWTSFRSGAASTGRSSAELTRRTESVQTVEEYAHLSRVAPDQLPFIYSAALLSDSADRVASYLSATARRAPRTCASRSRTAREPCNLLLQREVPVNRSPGPAMGAASAPGPRAPAADAGRQVRGLHPRALPAPARPRHLDRGARRGAVDRRRSSMRAPGVLAVVMSALLIVATEPFLLKAAPAVGIQGPPRPSRCSPPPPLKQNPSKPKTGHYGNLHTRINRHIRRAPGRHVHGLPPQDPGDRDPGRLAAPEAPPDGE